MQCQFYCNNNDALGIESEVKTSITTCNSKAIHVLRLVTIPENRIQAPLLFKRICVCTKHAEYLCNDAEFKWEKLHSTPSEQDPEQLIKVPEPVDVPVIKINLKSKRILHLTLKKKWFDEIINLQKFIEYREIKPYWTSRLMTAIISKTKLIFREFDEVHFKNGYSKNAPFMRVECRYIDYGVFEGKKHYAIHLGRILEIRNYENGH